MEKRLALCATLFLAACQTTSTADDQRGLWRADPGQPASCAGSCGGRSPDRCYCDPACTGWGDCCPDYAAVCSASDDGGAPAGDGGTSGQGDLGATTTSCGVCPASHPVCGSDGVCRKCVAHSECASGVCQLEAFAADAIGTCATADQVSRIDNRAETIADCKIDHPKRDGKSAATAYCDIAESIAALAGSTPVRYHLTTGHGTAFPYSPITQASALPVVVVGPGRDAPSPVVITSPSQPALSVQDASYTLVLDGVDLAGNASSSVVFLHGAAGTTTYVIIRRSRVHGGANGFDLAAYVANVTVTDSIISDNWDAAVYAAGGYTDVHTFLSLDGNLIVRNGLGLDLGLTYYSVVNNVIAFNGGRAVTLDKDCRPGSPGYGLSFNTIADNASGNVNGGVDCGPTPQLIESSIVVRNARSNNTQFTGNCVLVGVVAGDDPAPGALAVPEPLFVHEAASAPDFHLSTAAPANDACCVDRAGDTTVDGGAAQLPTRDYDGQPRPLGAARDVGADESR